MSSRALEFVEEWVSEKIEAEGYPPKHDQDARAKLLAEQCVEAAQTDGITASEIAAAFDDLTAFIQGQFDEARDRQAERARAKE